MSSWPLGQNTKKLLAKLVYDCNMVVLFGNMLKMCHFVLHAVSAF